ncbi:hypothetical protein TSAR_004078 [Trichomalopsis sarcophagae]|uniref:Uncharacterized protein n=1 Tax=Trichomalopsis sarcophagae TaxID=543379 RepID=A0A232EMQ7_9HYME|nr:hypothetical protein TSAR_004078 [Trichomalopsis sarcophagae]
MKLKYIWVKIVLGNTANHNEKKNRKRELSERFRRFENLFSVEEISSTQSPKRACSEINNCSGDCAESVYLDISDQEFQEDIQSEHSNGSDEENITESAQEINELRQWAIDCNIPHCDLDRLLKILNRRVLPDLPSCLKTFLKSNKKFEIEYMEVANDSAEECYYFGFIDQLRETVNLELHKSSTLELIFNIGGVSPFKSSTITLILNITPRRTQEIQKDIPDEFPRKMRLINDHSKYKAVEFKFFIVYAAPFLLKKTTI